MRVKCRGSRRGGVVAALAVAAAAATLGGVSSPAHAAAAVREPRGSTAAAESCEPSGAGHLAYSTNLDTDYNSVSVIDTQARKVVRSFPGFDIPANVTPVNNGSKLFVDQWGLTDGDTKVVNPCTGQIVKTIARPGGLFPLSNISSDGKWVYLAGIQGFTIERINAATDQVAQTYTTLGTGQPIGYAVPSPDGKTIWVAGLHDVFTIDVATGKLVGSPIPVGISPQWLSVTPDGKRAIATNFVSGTDSVIDTATRKVIATVNTGLDSYPNSASATPDSSQFWVGNLDGTVTVVNAADGKVVRTLDPGKFTLDATFSSDGRFAYVPTTPKSSPAINLNGAVTAFGLVVTGLWHPGPGNIAVYDTKTGKLVDTFKTGGIPSPVVTPPGPFTSSS